jgi:rhodanese-related sulfurtransferase
VLLPMQHLSVRFQTLVQHLDEPVYIYCNSGNRSATFARYLRTLGHTNSQSISGGYEAWGDPC